MTLTPSLNAGRSSALSKLQSQTTGEEKWGYNDDRDEGGGGIMTREGVGREVEEDIMTDSDS